MDINYDQDRIWDIAAKSNGMEKGRNINENLKDKEGKQRFMLAAGFPMLENQKGGHKGSILYHCTRISLKGTVLPYNQPSLFCRKLTRNHKVSKFPDILVLVFLFLQVRSAKWYNTVHIGEKKERGTLLLLLVG